LHFIEFQPSDAVNRHLYVNWIGSGEYLEVTALADTACPTESGRRTTDHDFEVSELVAGSLSGDSRAFEQLYRKFAGRIYALCLRLVADPAEAEILTQDTFVRTWQKLETYSGRGSFAAWLRRLAINVVIEDRRANARRARWFEPEHAKALSGEVGGDPGNSGSRRHPGYGVSPSMSDVRIDLERAIANLPPGARVAFVLHDVEGYRHREIAEMIGVTAGAIKAQLHRARRLLREALGSRPEIERP
jgi:RNA polymerase sigma-70 factor (ECF subfamily)